MNCQGYSYEETMNIMCETIPRKTGSNSSLLDNCYEEQNLSNREFGWEEKGFSSQIAEDYEYQSEEENKAELKCTKCNKEFSSKSSFLEHLQIYPGKVKSCVDCQQVFHNSMAFKFHKQLAMCGKCTKIFKCKLCSKTLYGSSQYSTHLSAHNRNQCKSCGEHFAKKKHLQVHTFNVHNASLNKNLFRCHLCERMFAQRRSLVYHYKIGHPEKCHICPVCLEMFNSSEHLATHEATHKRLTFTCPKCNEQFIRKQRFLTHMKEHDKFRCEDCNESFSAKKAADNHAKQGHIVKGLSQLQCSECGQMFCSRGLLRSHTAIHHSGKVFACEKCKISFKHERNYQSHLETNEHLNGEEPKNLLACKECNKTFTNKNNLRAHLSRMHNANLKEYCCTLCSYKTSISTNLKRHMNLHTEKPQFICDKCAAKFQTKSALLEHNLLIHSDRKDFSCDKCGNQFHRRSDLNRHLLNTHSDTAQYSCHCGNSYKTLSSLKRHQLLSHNTVDLKQKRLKKLFPVEVAELPKKKVKKTKLKVPSTSLVEVNDLQLINSEIPSVSSAAIPESSTVEMMAERPPEDLLQESYNIDFPTQIIEDKSQVIYAQNLDMNSFQVVESMIPLDSHLAKEGTSVLINVRNLFGRSTSNNYIIDNPVETSLVSNLSGSLTEIAVTNHKQDLIAGLQDFIIPHDLGFLNA